ncbi:MAG: tetratricopeptide repeat protein [Candidatus Babeliales bacterium]
MKHIWSGIVLTSGLLHATPAQDIHRYLWANYNQFGGNQTMAAQWYTNLINANAPLYMYKGYITFLYDTHNVQQIVLLMPKLQEAFSNDPDIQLLFARALDQVGKHEQAAAMIIRLSNTFKTNAEIVFQAASLYIQRKEPKNALKIIDDLLNNSPRKPNNFIFYFLKAQILVSLNQLKEALKNVKLCLEMYPQFDKGWLMRALLEEQLGQLDEAVKGFSTFLGVSATPNKEIEQHLTQLLYKQKIEQKRLDSLMLNKSCLEKALILADQKQYHQALKHLDICSEEQPNDADVYLLKIQILMSLQEYAQAAHIIKERLTKEPHNELWYQTLHLICRNGLTMQKAIALLGDVATKNPDLLLPYLYLADLHIRSDQKDSALLNLTKAAERASDPQLKVKILFQMGVLYYQHDAMDAMVKVLEQGMNLNSEFPPLLNLLAYHYATQGSDLTKAQKLISKALGKQPHNPHFIDTQAVIYYQQTHYTKALELLQSAIKQVPLDIMVLKHMGQTYYRLGNHQKARETLTKALSVATTDEEKNMCTNLLKSWELPS